MNFAIEEHFVKTNGIRLHVVTAGAPNGAPLILLHGFPEFWYGWRNQIPALAEAGFRIIVPDQRGYNLSDVPHGVHAYGLDMLVEDIVGVMEQFGIEKAHIVGHDWGAAVAWGLALYHPERVERLGILNVPHPEVMLKFLAKSPRQMLKSWYIGFFQLPWLPDWLLRLNNFAGAINTLQKSGLPNTFSIKDMDEYRRAYTNSGGLTGMINWYRALARYRPRMPKNIPLDMPVLIQWGKQDVALSAEMAEASLKLCKNGKLLFYENATHWVQHDEAEAVNKALITFLKD